MKTDPILQELWRTKDQLAAEAGYDLDVFLEQLQQWSVTHPGRGPVVHNAEELHQLATEKSSPRYSVVVAEPAQVRETPVTKSRQTRRRRR